MDRTRRERCGNDRADADRGARGDARSGRSGAASAATHCRRCGIGCTFIPFARQSEIGADGHALRGGFLPPVPLPRRMWAGSRFEWIGPLRVGDAAVRRLDASNRSPSKRGRSGELVFVVVRHEISTARRPRDRRGARYRLSRCVGRCADGRGAVAPAPPRWPGRGASCPTPCCSFAIRRSRSTDIASTTTAAMRPRSRVTPDWSCTGRCWRRCWSTCCDSIDPRRHSRALSFARVNPLVRHRAVRRLRTTRR